MTARPDEIAALDDYAFPPVLGANWERTGPVFQVYKSAAEGTAPVCRFFGVFGALSSHFYTGDEAECAELPGRFPVWRFEDIAFHAALPDLAGDCPFSTVPLYRAYNKGISGAPNHRYTTDLATQIDFVTVRGWVAEGRGPLGVALCVPVMVP